MKLALKRANRRSEHDLVGRAGKLAEFGGEETCIAVQVDRAVGSTAFEQVRAEVFEQRMVRPIRRDGAKRQIIVYRDRLDHVLGPTVEDLNLVQSFHVTEHSVAFVAGALLSRKNAVDRLFRSTKHSIPASVRDHHHTARLQNFKRALRITRNIWSVVHSMPRRKRKPQQNISLLRSPSSKRMRRNGCAWRRSGLGHKRT